MPRTTRFLMVAAVAGLAMVMAACGGGGATETKPEDGARAAAAALFTGPAGQSLGLEMTDLKFSTTALVAKSGELLEVALANNGSIEHDFSIAKLPGEKALRVGDKDTDVAKGKNEVHAHLRAGQTGAVRMRASSPGAYEFFCTVPGHKEAGMKGTFTVQ